LPDTSPAGGACPGTGWKGLAGFPGLPVLP